VTEHHSPGGYAGRFLRVDLTSGSLTDYRWAEESLRKWVGGSGVGIRILYDEVGPSVQWDEPENRLIMSTGPLAGTSVMGTGAVCVVTKGALTGGATTSQANGFMGAYMKFSGYDGVILQGRSEKWVYVYLHDGVAELRDAEHLLGLDTYDLQDRIAEELGKKERQVSVLGIGPAGENVVRFAAIAGDKGHVAGHNGTGAVMGSKRVKAIVAERGRNRFPLAEPKLLAEKARAIVEEMYSSPATSNTLIWGTSNSFVSGAKAGWLPVKNYTTNIFPEADRFSRPAWEGKWEPRPFACWACRSTHVRWVKVTEGKYAGFETEEPEYEQWAAWGSQIGNPDPAEALVLCNLVDRLGLENNEAGWVIGWVMECYEKGLLSQEELGGLEMTWGKAEATRELLRRIAHREGIGDLLAEGVKRASEKLGRGSDEFAIFTARGNSPRGHDHRGRWVEMVDTAVSDTGTFSVGPTFKPQEQGAKPKIEEFNPDDIAEQLGKANGRTIFEDCLGICRFTARTTLANLGATVGLATGWSDFSGEEALEVGRRTANLLRVFNLRSGFTPDLEKPSKRYGSTPVDGPLVGKSIAEHWEYIRRKYYELMGWDYESGRPLPETLEKLGLSDVVSAIWG
jgi:aldehyde:ferredoxin oxidoreductase